MSHFDIAQNVINTEVPYFPSYSWQLTAADFAIPTLWVFNWVQAFYDASLAVQPTLVVSTGETGPDGTLIASAIYFAYSGERINFKGKILLASGTDRRGNMVTSTPIDAEAPTSSLENVIVYGGNY